MNGVVVWVDEFEGAENYSDFDLNNDFDDDGGDHGGDDGGDDGGDGGDWSKKDTLIEF